MKTLKDLKSNANKFKWSLIKNSWYQSVPDFQKSPRKVGQVLTNKFSLITIKNGVESESWLDFPKAKELSINKFDNGVYEITINKILQEYADGSIQYHLMIYRLYPIFNFSSVSLPTKLAEAIII